MPAPKPLPLPLVPLYVPLLQISKSYISILIPHPSTDWFQDGSTHLPCRLPPSLHLQSTLHYHQLRWLWKLVQDLSNHAYHLRFPPSTRTTQWVPPPFRSQVPLLRESTLSALSRLQFIRCQPSFMCLAHRLRLSKRMQRYLGTSREQHCGE